METVGARRLRTIQSIGDVGATQSKRWLGNESENEAAVA